MAATIPAANIHREARARLNPGKKAIRPADIVILFLFLAAPLMASGDLSNHMVPGFIVANPAWLCHKRKLHRPADRGLPWRCPCWLFHLRNNLALSTL
jgi:hypothetical protein